MPRKDRFSQQQVIDALTQGRGIIRAAAKGLHCDYHTVSNYIRRYPAVREGRDLAVQSSIDLAYSKLLDLVEQGDWTAIRFLLVTLGKDRGFTERTEVAKVGAGYEERLEQFNADLAKVYGDGRD